MNISKPQNSCPNNPLRFFSFPLLLIFSITSPSAEAQASSPPPQNQLYNPSFTPSMGVIIILLTTSLFFMAVFSLYLRHCSRAPSTPSIRNTLSLRRRAVAARGLHASVIETFPTFTYAEVKDKRIGKVGSGLECAVCLNEFEDDETLRLIPKCDHVFHPECIDKWLQFQVTCPVCRAKLDEVVEAAPPLVPPLVAEGQRTESTVREEGRNEDVLVGVDCGEEEQNGEPVLNRHGSLNRVLRSWSIKIRRPRMFGFGRFRSHSTGHLLVLPGENLDRFTLRLPEGVRTEMLNRALLNRNESCVGRVEGEGSLRGGSRVGGVRFIGRTIDIPDRGARSDRWAFFTRVLSMKSPNMKSPKMVDNGFGSTSKSPESMVKMPSFKCLESKSSKEIETSLVRSCSFRPPV